MRFNKKELILLEYLLGSLSDYEVMKNMEESGHTEEKAYEYLVNEKVYTHNIYIKICKEMKK